MKKFKCHFKKSFIAASFILFFPSGVFAANGNSIAALIDYLKAVVKKTADSVASLVYEFNPSLPETIQANVAQKEAEDIASVQSRAMTVCQIYNTLPKFYTASPLPRDLKILNPGNRYKTLAAFCEQDRNVRGVVQENISELIGTDSASLASTGTRSVNIGAYTGVSPEARNVALGNKNFNFDALVTPSLYDIQTQRHALNFINFTAELYKPLYVESRLEKISRIKRRMYLDYRSKIRSYVAAQSVALSNLYHMVADRIEQKQISQLGLKDDQQNVIKSPQQYRRFLATRRTNNEAWYEMVNKASPATVSRETLLVLAEIERHMYRLEQVNERILATLSVIQLQNLSATMRPKLEKDAAKIDAEVRRKATGRK